MLGEDNITSQPLDVALKIINTLFEGINDVGINLVSNDYTVVWTNNAMSAGVKKPVSEMIGKPCYEAFRHRNSPCPTCLLKTVSETKEPLIAERWLDLPNQKRQYAEVRLYPILDSHESVQYIFEMLTFITNKKKGEKERTRYIQVLERTLRESRIQNSETNLKQGNSNSEQLTPREREILCLIGRGFSNKQIGLSLNISIETVKTHIKSIFWKIDVVHRAEAATWAATHGIL
ncbi:MAG: LuxR C-terminal-related transcriptional regulator [Syntrophobacterales bacterium]|jgi:DNA-binding CsgD family transcriptional regulator|nr:LuxR C-terminal-related transcriptional regulator [Syntrophobacterales bacterium]